MITVPSEFYFDTGSPMSDGSYFENISLTHTIAASGMLSFGYAVSFSSHYSPFSGDVAGYTINGAFTALPAGPGSVDITVNQGDLFGFYLSAGPRCVTCQPAWDSETVLNVTNFSAPIPEPSVVSLVFTASAALAGARARLRRRRRFAQKVLM
jgi:hypothetical protein